jgi:transposase-like protein
MTTSNDQQGEQKVSDKRNGHRPRAETLPRAEVPSADTADGLMAGASVTDVAPHSERDGHEPHLNSAEGDGPTRASANGSLSTLAESLEGVRERLGLPRREWPVEAERSSERRRYKQAIAVELLASGMTVTEVAKKLGVDPSTVHRWLNDSFFVAELEARRDELIDAMLDQHLLASRMATAKLMKLMDSDNEQVALRAAATLYAGGQRAYQFMDVRKRIERLEDNMGIVYGFKV